jgi:hypothetical protein
MHYSNRIKTLEESYNQVEIQISIIEKSENPNQEKLSRLHETKTKYLNELRIMRRAQYESQQEVDLGDDR